MTLSKLCTLTYALAHQAIHRFGVKEYLSKLYTYTCDVANQAIHPFRVGKLVPAICRSRSALHSVRGCEVGSRLLVRTSVSH